jgi:hypothetical protein
MALSRSQRYKITRSVRYDAEPPSPVPAEETCREKSRVGTGAGEDQERLALRAELTYAARLIEVTIQRKVVELRPLLWIDLVAWAFVGFALRSWRIALIGYVAMLPLLAVFRIWGEYRRMRRERRDTLLRRGVPHEKI